MGDQRAAGADLWEHLLITVATVNVNGIRAAAGKGLREWLAGTPAGVVCLQETRALPGELPELPGWHVTLAPAQARGRNGVAVLTRDPPGAVRAELPELPGQGRYLEVDLPGVTVASVYLPKGGGARAAGTPRQEEKDRYLAAFAEHLGKTAADGRDMVVAGDFNIAPAEADLKNWKANLAHSGFLPHERAWMVELTASWTDTVRALHPGPGPYTWWSYRGRAYDTDAGWRIDHVLATPGLVPRAFTVDRAPSYAARWSDHAPVVVELARP